MMRRLLIVVVGLALLCGAGAAAASVPGADGTIHGCYQTAGLGDGALYVIDSEATCPTGFTSLDWDQAAPVGLAGYEVVGEELAIAGPDPAGTDTRTIYCPTGKVVLGGSAGTAAGRPRADGTGWEFDIAHPTVSPGSTFVSNQWVTCATEAPTP